MPFCKPENENPTLPGGLAAGEVLKAVWEEDRAQKMVEEIENALIRLRAGDIWELASIMSCISIG